MFVASGIFLTVTVGAFMSLMITNTFFENSKNAICKTIFGVVLACAIGFGIGGLMTMEYNGDTKSWNNGQCEECGGQWELADVVHYRNSGDKFYWSCIDCKNVIETHRNFK